ncbi:unnamed protein product [Effrenium voratum]|uniref:Ubiquitin-like domain-containing protein n=1 Tax=Effrenium voratum TaxID=2562239 RepID=A0AA36J8M6_9DINO|nr:unnamed protein product [Effrenium voratum]CAJ1401650.1 unnamed protein product [Effrenium voratum]CAJ1459969.1 unnamed protein product [Effrenium voratum]
MPGADGDLTLWAIIPTGGECREVELTARPQDTGVDLKKMIEKAVNIPVDDMEIFVKNPSGSKQKWLRDDATLESEEIEDSAVLTVGVHGTGGRQTAVVSDDELPQDAVQNSIAVKGDSSYYFAHSRKMDVPEEHRIVSGGAPQRLGEAEALKEPVRQVLEGEEPQRPERAILNYAWGDEKEAVKLYVSAEAEPEALGAAQDWVLDLDRLYYEIIPEECKFRVSENKRITLTLKKKEAYAWLKLLKPDA